ncbi:MAG: hypothetical protein ACOYD1_12820 [Candidatus Nanopelagicales bacterium]
MQRITKKPGPANLLERLSSRTRDFLGARGVQLEQALGLVGQVGRPTQPPPAPAAPLAGKLSRRDRRAVQTLEHAAARAKRRAERDTRYERRFAERMAQWGAEAPPGGWRTIPREVWVMAWDCEADGTGHALRYWIRREPNKVFVGAARAAALAGGRTWHSQTARRIMTCALVQARLSAPTQRKGRWASIVRGVPVGAFSAMLAPPTAGARRPHRNTLTGFHRGLESAADRGQVGYLRALELAGAMYSQQLPADEVEAFERCGSSGHACNRYWLISAHPSNMLEQADREQLIELHRAGQAAASETLLPRRRSPNPAESRAQQLRAAVFGPPAHPPPE